MQTLNLRTSDLVLDRVLNPTQSPDIGNARPSDIIEACGLIPDFFADACLAITYEGAGDTLDDLAGAIDNLYGCGGFNSYHTAGRLPTMAPISASTKTTTT